MTQRWEPEQTLEAPLALRLIQEQFPELGANRIKLLGAGWDNTAFLVNEDLIFRFPRREISVPLLDAEWELLPKLATQLPQPIPVPKWRGIPTAAFPWPFLGYKMLPGLTACHVHLTEAERESLAEPIAHFLRALHSTPPSLLAECSISGDNLGRVNWQRLVVKIGENFADLSELQLLKHKERLESVVASLHDLKKPTMHAVVHGDFYVRHLLVDQKHQLAGVIDWGDIHLGDPAIDLSIAHSFLPPHAHNAFKRAYGDISPETWSLAKLRAIYSATLLVLFGHHINDADILREGLRSLQIWAQE